MIGERLAEIRKDHGDNQDDLARKLNVSVFAIRSWEQEKSAPSHEMLVRVCRLYQVSSDYLLGLSNIDPVHEQRRRHPLQVQRLRQMVLKSPLDQADSGLRFIKAQFRLITGRDKGFAHSSRPFAIKDLFLPIIAFFREIVMYSFCL